MVVKNGKAATPLEDTEVGLPIIGNIIEAISGGYSANQETKARINDAKVDLKVAKIEAKTARFKTTAKVEADYDQEALRQSQFSWKDEFWTVIFAAPFVGAFIPGLQDYVLGGFKIIAQTPYWYQISILGMIAATFGLRWWFTKKKI